MPIELKTTLWFHLSTFFWSSLVPASFNLPLHNTLCWTVFPCFVAEKSQFYFVYYINQVLNQSPAHSACRVVLEHWIVVLCFVITIFLLKLNFLADLGCHRASVDWRRLLCSCWRPWDYFKLSKGNILIQLPSKHNINEKYFIGHCSHAVEPGGGGGGEGS